MAKCKEIEFINYNGGIDNLKIQNTAFLREALTEYLHSNCDDIYKAYGRPSTKKVTAFNHIKKEYKKNNEVREARIIRKCINNFSMGAIIEKDKRKYFIYDTKDKRRCLDCTDLL